MYGGPMKRKAIRTMSTELSIDTDDYQHRFVAKKEAKLLKYNAEHPKESDRQK
jgi:hypothetical protein